MTISKENEIFKWIFVLLVLLGGLNVSWTAESKTIEEDSDDQPSVVLSKKSVDEAKHQAAIRSDELDKRSKRGRSARLSLGSSGHEGTPDEVAAEVTRRTIGYKSRDEEREIVSSKDTAEEKRAIFLDYVSDKITISTHADLPSSSFSFHNNAADPHNLRDALIAEKKFDDLTEEQQSFMSRMQAFYAFSPLQIFNPQNLFNWMTHMRALERLSLQDTPLVGAHIEEVLEATFEMHDLEELYLDGSTFNLVREKGEVVEGASKERQLDRIKLLARVIHVHPKLRKLGIREINMDADGANILAPALEKLKQLEHLNLGYNPLWDLGFKAVARALAANKQLRWLNISNINVSSASGAPLRDIYEANIRLSALYACENIFGDEGMEPFLRELLERVRRTASGGRLSLRSIDLSNTGMAEKSFSLLHQAIEMAIQKNLIWFLERLSLHRNLRAVDDDLPKAKGLRTKRLIDTIACMANCAQEKANKEPKLVSPFRKLELSLTSRTRMNFREREDDLFDIFKGLENLTHLRIENVPPQLGGLVERLKKDHLNKTLKLTIKYAADEEISETKE